MAKQNAASAPVAEAQTEPLAVDIPSAARVPKIRLITRTEIHPDPEQPRQAADAELRDSLARNGMLQPITVRPHPTRATEWMIVDGERRWRSSDGVMNDLPCIVRQDMETLARRLATQLEANTGKSLTPLEEARAFAAIMSHEGISTGELAAFLGRAPSTVAERVALLELGPWLPLIERGAVVMSHAVKVLLPLRTLGEATHAALVEGVTKETELPVPTVDEFRDAVRHALRPFLYPLRKTTAYGAKNPEFNTSKHGAECDCGTVTIKEGYPAKDRAYCANPEWWKPKHTGAVKAAKAKEKAAKQAGGGEQAPDALRVYLPEDAAVKKANSWEEPSGIIILSRNGTWWPGHHYNRIDFNPAEVAGNCRAQDLVELRGSAREYPRVGILESAPCLPAARAAWAERWNARREVLASELGVKLSAQLPAERVEGDGARRLLVAIVNTCRGSAARDLVDVAQALGRPYPSVTDERGEQLDAIVREWIQAVPLDELQMLATGVAAFIALEIDSITDTVENEAWEALSDLSQKNVPWLKAPKGKKAARPAPLVVEGKKLSGETIPLALDEDDDEADGGWGTNSGDDDGDERWDAAEDEDEEEDAPLVQARER